MGVVVDEPLIDASLQLRQSHEVDVAPGDFAVAELGTVGGARKGVDEALLDMAAHPLNDTL